MRELPTNPYRNLPFPELYQACQRRAGDLLDRKRGTMTPAERAELAHDTGYLLLAVAFAINSGEYTPGTPEWEISRTRSTVAEAFGSFHAKELRNLRHRTLARAASHVIGAGWRKWLIDQRIDVSASEEDLIDALLRLSRDSLELCGYP